MSKGHKVFMSKSIGSKPIMSVGVRSRSLRSKHFEKCCLKNNKVNVGMSQNVEDCLSECDYDLATTSNISNLIFIPFLIAFLTKEIDLEEINQP